MNEDGEAAGAGDDEPAAEEVDLETFGKKKKKKKKVEDGEEGGEDETLEGTE